MINLPPDSPLDALRELQRRLKCNVDEPSDEWFTIADLQQVWELSNSRTSFTVREAVKAGLAERQTFRIEAGSSVRPVPHYRFPTLNMKKK